VTLIGIMQGRLSPPLAGRIQSFPADTWRAEFALAQRGGLSCIEWIYETGTDSLNPLRNKGGIREIRRLAEESGVAVQSVCADYYMVERLVHPGGDPNLAAIGHLQWLIEQVAQLGARYIVLPFVDSSRLGGLAEVTALLEVLSRTLPVAEQARVELHLETDLDSRDLADVFAALPHRWLRANYDMGNSAALGRNPEAEFRVLAPLLGSVHVKDRVVGGETVALGTGAVRFDVVFQLIRTAGYGGPLILQTARDFTTSELDLAIRNRRFIESHSEGAPSLRS
jgi:hexulose-6-phosphate isomerase